MSVSKRPHPFIMDHEWVVGCSLCPFDHSKHQKDPAETHCRKCGITLSRAKAREDDIDVEACPIREVRECRKCGRISPIQVDSPESYSVCTLCQHPDIPMYHSAAEALKAMQDISAGVQADPPKIKGPKKLD